MPSSRSCARIYVQNHCIAFWGFLLIFVALGGGGVYQLIKRDEVFSEGSEYDWDVNSELPVQQNDMAAGARHFANRVQNRINAEANGRRRLASKTPGRTLTGRTLTVLDPDEEFEDERIDPPPGAVEDPRRLGARRRLFTAEGNYWHDGRLTLSFRDPSSDGNIMTPQKLRDMCEVENVVLGVDIEYEENCVNPTLFAGQTPKDWMRSCHTRPDGNTFCCLMPTTSIVSLFYQKWASPGAEDNWAAGSSYSQVFQELFWGVSWNSTRFDLANLPNAPRTEPWNTGDL